MLAFAAIALLCLVGLVVAIGLWRHNLRQEVNRQTAAIREQGLPLNFEDLERWPVATGEETNAALIISGVLWQREAAEITNGVRGELPRRCGPLTPEMRDSVAAVALASRPYFEMLLNVSNVAWARYPINYHDGPNASLLHLSQLKSMANALSCEVIVRAEETNAEAAVAAIETILKLSKSLDNEPTLVSQLTSAGILALAVQSFERAICRTQLSAAQLARLERQFTEAEATNRMAVGLIGERAFGNEMLRLAQEDVRQFITIANQAGGEEDERVELPSSNPGVLWRLTGFFERDRNFLLRAIETNIHAVSLGPPASLSLTNQIDRLIVDAREGFYMMSGMLLPSFGRVVARDALIRAELRVAMVVAALEQYRLRHDKLPESLEELVPPFINPLPLDPFDGKPLRFKKLSPGYVVYSIGPNQQDDGGKEMLPRSVKVPREQREQYDITFTVER